MPPKPGNRLPQFSVEWAGAAGSDGVVLWVGLSIRRVLIRGASGDVVAAGTWTICAVGDSSARIRFVLHCSWSESPALLFRCCLLPHNLRLRNLIGQALAFGAERDDQQIERNKQD